MPKGYRLFFVPAIKAEVFLPQLPMGAGQLILLSIAPKIIVAVVSDNLACNDECCNLLIGVFLNSHCWPIPGT